jgi:hypothetical protein
MGIETDAKYDGSESSFMSAILTIEELAKVDPSISVICDVQVQYLSLLFQVSFPANPACIFESYGKE